MINNETQSQEIKAFSYAEGETKVAFKVPVNDRYKTSLQELLKCIEDAKAEIEKELASL